MLDNDCTPLVVPVRKDITGRTFKTITVVGIARIVPKQVGRFMVPMRFWSWICSCGKAGIHREYEVTRGIVCRRCAGLRRQFCAEWLKDTLTELNDDLSLPWDTYPCVFWPYSRQAPKGKDLDHGYGHFTEGGKKIWAHRRAYELTHGEIPNGFDVAHFCDQPPCFRGSHTFAATHAENMHDMVKKGRSGERRRCFVLTAEQVEEIKLSLFSRLVTIPHLAERFSVSSTTIKRAIARERDKHGGLPYGNHTVSA